MFCIDLKYTQKSKLLNYGYCYQHHNEVLKEEMFPLMEKYMGVDLFY